MGLGWLAGWPVTHCPAGQMCPLAGMADPLAGWQRAAMPGIQAAGIVSFTSTLLAATTMPHPDSTTTLFLLLHFCHCKPVLREP